MERLNIALETTEEKTNEIENIDISKICSFRTVR